MSSAVDIQIVNPPNLVKIENFLNNSTYRETIEISANFNTRLCIERRLRLPFLDPQTKIAQNHSNLFLNKRQRMPGFQQGQIYSYPAARWRKTRRQYLSKMYRYSDRPFQSFKKEIGGSIVDTTTMDSDFNGTILEESSSLGGADTSDSKDSQQLAQQQQQQSNLKEELPKEWFYDELELNDMDGLEEPKSPADDEYDYDPRYGNKKRKKRRPGKKAASFSLPMESVGGPRKGRPSGSGIGTNNTSGGGVGGGIGVGGGGGSDTPRSSTGRGRGRRKRGTGGGGSDSTRHKDRTSRSPGLNAPEPPSFETAAASVPPDGELRNYEKYL